MGSHTLFSLEDHDEVLKEEAAAIIRTFHLQNPEVKIVAPTKIRLCRDGICILDCADLSEKSINLIRQSS